VASVWEIAIKASLGKLTLMKPLGDLLPALLSDSGIKPLPIKVAVPRTSRLFRLIIATHSTACWPRKRLGRPQRELNG